MNWGSNFNRFEKLPKCSMALRFGTKSNVRDYSLSRTTLLLMLESAVYDGQPSDGQVFGLH